MTTYTISTFSEKYKKEEESGEWDVWSLLKNAASREYEAIGFKFGICDMRAMLRRLSNTKKRETQKAACKNTEKKTYIPFYI